MAQEFPQPLEDEAQVVADGAHDGVDLVAVSALEEVAAQVAVGFAMTDDGFDGGSPSELLLDLSMDAALLPRFEDPERFGRIVALVACQSALNIDPLSASNIDPSCGREEVVPVVNREAPRGFV